MRPAAARASLLALTALALALVAFNVDCYAGLGWTGDAGWVLVPGARSQVAIASVSPGGAATRAGLRPRDEIDLRALPVADRVFVLDAPLANRPLDLSVVRGGARVRATVLPEPTRLRWDTIFGNGILAWMAIFAGIIAWRRPRLPEARLLSLALSAYVVADVLQYVVTPSAAVNLAFVAFASAGIGGAVALAALLRFSARFGVRGPARRAVETLAAAALVALAAFGIAAAAAFATLTPDPGTLYLGTLGVVLACVAQCAVLAAGVAALVASRGAERQRVAWALLAFGTLLAAAVLQIAVDNAVPTRDAAIATSTLSNVTAIVAPVGLTYAVLSRRLLDIGFVLNRAAVFSSVSLIVVGTFMLAEWALGNWLTSSTNAAVSAVLALGLGFSIRFIHERVDHVVDRAFFRKRHEQERALLRFAHETAFVTSVPALVERTVDEIARHSDAERVALLLHERGGGYAGGGLRVEENEPAMVALRATLERVDLHAHPGALPGEYAFPLVSRGELLGVIACGAKRSGDPYAPDELRTFDAVAHAVGIALGALDAQGSGGAADGAALQFEIAALRAEIRALVEALAQTRAAER